MRRHRSYGGLKKVLTFLCLTSMVATALPQVEAKAEEHYEDVEASYVLDAASDLTAFAAETKADGDSENAGTDGYFTVIYSKKSKVDSSKKDFEDGYSSSQRINFGGKAETEKNSVKIVTAGPATIKVWWVSGGDMREITALNAEGSKAAATAVGSVKNNMYISTLSLADAGTYYLGGDTGSNYIFKILVTETKKVLASQTFTLEASSLTAFNQGDKGGGDSEAAGEDNYFTVIYSKKSKVDSSKKDFEDGYSSSQRINFGGKATTSENAVKFTTQYPNTQVKVWWVSGGDMREITALNAEGINTATTAEGSVKNNMYISTLSLADAGTYYLGGDTGSNYIFKILVTETVSEVAKKAPRKDFNEVAAPVITEIKQIDGKISVTVNAEVGYDGGDKVEVFMKDSFNEETLAASSAEKSTHTKEFSPMASGDYTFYAVLSRTVTEGENTTIYTKASEVSVNFTYVYPLLAPSVSGVTNEGERKISVNFTAVKEAEKYVISIKDTEITKETLKTEETVDLSDLEVGDYILTVSAIRGEETKTSAEFAFSLTENSETKWLFSAYGQGVNEKNNGYTGSVKDGKVTVYSESGKGKIVPNSTDGLAFYYTRIPSDKNFSLKARVTVDSWTFSNGQEGFGMMLADSVGENYNNANFWNNSIQSLASKIEYYYDAEKNEVTTDSTKSKITMKLGIGVIKKLGVTKKDVESFKTAGVFSRSDGTTAAIPEGFSTVTETLDSSCGSLGVGTYNIIGNYTKETGNEVTDGLVTSFIMELRRDNTGYLVSYYDLDGNLISSNRVRDVERTALTTIDEDFVYAGFIASRNARASFTDVCFEMHDTSEDAQAEEQKTSYIEPVYTVESASSSNTSEYELVFNANADGVLTITNEKGDVIEDKAAVTANARFKLNLALKAGTNTFNLLFAPDADYKPASYVELSSYEAKAMTHTVTYNTIGAENGYIFVSPKGTLTGTGAYDSPLDIYTAVKYVRPGQTIVLLEGTYSLTSTVKVERNIDGTSDKLIYMIADPNASTRPVFDFNASCAGFVLGGDYWYFKGFDVTNSANSQKGLQLSGSNNVLDDIHAYKNGNTGIQIARYSSKDTFEDWPHDNLVLNCDSYLNADAGYEDADGFAAKLTIGNGNVFDGCVAYYNADDGWDLFAKAETGSIGKVVIKNCVAFKNGYILDENGNEINAGNGNGFKMGGDSLSGYHELIDSTAFYNKAKGIDSNSCPDIQVKNSISFDNESYNVAFYTNSAVNTDFAADGVVSYRKNVNLSTAENIKLKGTQDHSKVYKATDFYWDGRSYSSNTEDVSVSDDWFESLEYTGFSRDENNALVLNGGFLKLTEKAPVTAGLKTSAASSKITVPKSAYETSAKENEQAKTTASKGSEGVAENTTVKETAHLAIAPSTGRRNIVSEVPANSLITPALNTQETVTEAATEEKANSDSDIKDAKTPLSEASELAEKENAADKEIAEISNSDTALSAGEKSVKLMPIILIAGGCVLLLALGGLYIFKIKKAE